MKLSPTSSNSEAPTPSETTTPLVVDEGTASNLAEITETAETTTPVNLAEITDSAETITPANLAEKTAPPLADESTEKLPAADKSSSTFKDINFDQIDIDALVRHLTTQVRAPERVIASAPSLPLIELDEISQEFAKYVLEQREAYKHTLPGSEEKIENPSEAWKNASSTITPELMSVNNMLNAEHVDVMLRILVTAKPSLNNVGIFPIFSVDAFKHVAQTIAYKAIIVDERYKYLLPATKPLPEKSTITDPTILQERNFEEKRRENQEKRLRLEADRMLQRSNVNILDCHLKMVNSSDQILGHPNNPNLKFDECQQWILPFRKNGNHYTVAVINTVIVDERKTAKIKYYDSLGGDFDQSYRTVVEQFFRAKGFVTKYKCVSKQDQKGDNNCGIFACLKALDIVNKNIGDPERRLVNFKKNYSAVLNQYRIQFALILKDQGCAVEMSKDLLHAHSRYQKAFIQKSVEQKQIEDLYWIFQQQIDELKKSAGTDEVEAPLEKSISDSDVDAKFKKWSELGNRINRNLEGLLSKEEPTEEDRAQIESLMAMLTAYEEAEKEVKAKLIQLAEEQAEKNMTLIEKFLLLSWKKIFLILCAGGLGIYFGIPLALSVGLSAFQFATQYLPLNPLMTILGGAFIFSAAFELVRFFIGEDSEPAKIIPKVANVSEPEAPSPVKDNNKAPTPLVHQFENKKKSKPSTENGDVPAKNNPLTEEYPSTVNNPPKQSLN